MARKYSSLNVLKEIEDGEKVIKALQLQPSLASAV
jgi:hypothetical protein